MAGEVATVGHIRKRHIEKHIEKLLSFCPIVGFLGHRQVGKTTTLEDIAASYVTMDTKSEAESAALDPDGFVDQFSSFPCGIDECQLVPALFPALKDRVRRVRRPGQMLLTGSVRCFSGEKRPSLYLEDCGEAYHLTDSRIDQSTMWVSVVATQLRSIFDIPLSGADGAIARLSQFRTGGGAYIPLIVSRKDRHLGSIPILEIRPTPTELGSARSLLKALPKTRVVFVTIGEGSRLISANMLSIPGGLMMLYMPCYDETSSHQNSTVQAWSGKTIARHDSQSFSISSGKGASIRTI